MLETFPSLVLGRRLGAGASAEVIEASADGRAVLVKLGHDARVAAILASEARALLHVTAFDDKAIPALLGAGWFEQDGATLVSTARGKGRPGLVLQSRVGSPLLHAGALSDGRARAVLADVAGQLAPLHEAGLCHGDLKPDNVLVDERGAFLVDFGLAGPAGARAPRGGTPRYLALEYGDVGDGRARDLLALALTIAEGLQPALRGSAQLTRDARELFQRRNTPLASLLHAMLAPSPEARPGAAWVSAALRHGSLESRHWRKGRIAAAYLGSYLPRLGDDGVPHTEAHAILVDHCNALRAIAVLEPEAAPSRQLKPLRTSEKLRLLARITGHGAFDAAFGELDERVLIDRLLLAAEVTELRALSAQELTRRLLTDAVDQPTASPYVHASEADLALALGLSPPPMAALAEIEERPNVATSLVVACARALRRLGETGRARALAARFEQEQTPEVLIVAAEIERQAGEPKRAAELATRVLEGDPTPPALEAARAILARVDIDAGHLNEAVTALTGTRSGVALQTLALALAQRGDRAGAMRCLERAELVGGDAEERARLYGLRGYVLAPIASDRAFEAYQLAAEHARIASATLEEATYLTGLSATGADAGYLERALEASERALLLWEALGRSPRAARAALNAAAIEAIAGRSTVAVLRAEEARELARSAGDERAAGYALLVAVDAGVRDPESAGELQRLLRTNERDPELLRFAARALRLGLLDEAEVARLDRWLTQRDARGGASDEAQCDWIAARCEGATEPSDEVFASAAQLLQTSPAIGSRGPMLAAVARSARAHRRSELALQFSAALRSAASLLIERCGPTFASAVAALPWVRAAELSDARVERPREQVARLEQLVRSLAGSTKLRELLRDVLDALVGWTGVERGLLLLRAPDGRLAVRAARNLAERDLSADELGLSRTLAQLALDRGEPVVATDADRELGTVHQSVHLLKLRSVLAVPLFARGAPLGVVYLDDRVKRGAFGPSELEWVRTVATLAAAMVDRALTQAKLARSLRRAARREHAVTRDLAAAEVQLGSALKALASQRELRGGPFAAIIGESPAITTTIRVAERVAASELPALLAGESGSGKELFARAMHAASSRSSGPFVSENVSAIPDGLLESTLFGHVRGAFTGADRGRVGLFEAADGGTLFLDEVGEMSLAMQSKLLRVLEDGVLHPLGTERTRRVDVRLIAATHRDLGQLVEARQFREDLFYRLTVVTVSLPPLRERLEDLALLLRHFVQKHAGGRDVRLAPDVLDELMGRPWPGNVRQLENEVRRALVFADNAIERRHFRAPSAPAASDDAGLDLKRRVELLETALVREALDKTQGNQTRAAALLGVSRFGLQKMIKRLGLGALTRG